MLKAFRCQAAGKHYNDHSARNGNDRVNLKDFVVFFRVKVTQL